MSEVNKKLAAFERLGFTQNGEVGDQAFGDCIFCGKENKMYVSLVDGRWDCKVCALSGNMYSFIREWYNDLKSSQSKADRRAINILATHRGIKEETLHDLGVLWDKDNTRWIIPVYNKESKLVNIQFYRPDAKIPLIGMPDFDLRLGFVDLIKKEGPIYITEGFWDAAIFLEVVRTENIDCDVVWAPGAGVFKDKWVEFFVNRDVIYLYDNDDAGEKGKNRTAKLLAKIARSHSELIWEEEEPVGFDIRGLILSLKGNENVYQEIQNRVRGIENKAKSSPEKRAPQTELEPSKNWKEDYDCLPMLDDLSQRSTFTDVVNVFERWLEMPTNMTDALKIIFAVLLSSDLEKSDPLWMHIVGPPGCGKTELLMSTVDCVRAKPVSSIGPHMLISGFKTEDNVDPSLLPDLFDRTLIVKDFTEVVRMHSKDKDLVYSILRGAYDGNAERPFGNGVVRSYQGYFSIITGVTQTIFGEADSPVGERFLMYHAVKGLSLIHI